MAVNLTDADAYIRDYVIDNEDWFDADTEKKQRILNVASRTLSTAYPQFTIPDEAVYEFAAVLAVTFNDTNKLAQQGVASFSISGVASFNFDKTGRPGTSLTRFIPRTALELIGQANGVKLGARIGRTVL